MTRINVGYPVENLTRQHLIAEHREIKRIPNIIKSRRAVIKDIPDTFCLGKGHVRFFYNKLEYLLNRYREIYKECIKRGYKVQNYESCWNGIPVQLMNDWKPMEQDKRLIIERISAKLNKYFIV